jgi:hypothetical protein
LTCPEDRPNIEKIRIKGDSMKFADKPQSSDISTAERSAVITLDIGPDLIQRVGTLLSRACFVRIRTGCTMRQLICEQFHISPDYLKQEIKVFFLNYSPVDNLDEAIIRDGATVALSAAMPGLVGASMRSGGLSWMRSSITYHDEGGDLSEGEGIIQIKLFNQVMADLAELFLRRGVYVKSSFLADFLQRFDEDFWLGFSSITKSGEIMNRSGLIDFLNSDPGWAKVTIS